MADLLAARRDASWYRSPGSAWKYHIVGAVDSDGGAVAPACDGRVAVNMHDGAGMALNETTQCRAADVDPVQRCQRPGCKARWPRG